MKIIQTQGRGASQAEKMLAALEQRGSTALDSVLPAVSRIVTGVRNHGDRALHRYAAQFDGLKDTAALRIAPVEMSAAWDTLPPLFAMLYQLPLNRFEPLPSINFRPRGVTHRLTASPPASLCALSARLAAMFQAAGIRCHRRC